MLLWRPPTEPTRLPPTERLVEVFKEKKKVEKPQNTQFDHKINQDIMKELKRQPVLKKINNCKHKWT
jgi:hypothetical protein